MLHWTMHRLFSTACDTRLQHISMSGYIRL